MTVIKTKTEKVIENDRLTSRSHLGIGKINITKIVTTPRANIMSPRAKALRRRSIMSLPSASMASSVALGEGVSNPSRISAVVTP